jgi:lipopolysaccharide export system permease protein
MAFNEARTDLYLTLHDGVVHEVQRDREGGFQRLFFVRQIVPLREVGNELERRMGGTDRSDREMGFELLAENARSREEQLDSVRTENRRMALEAVRHALNTPAEADSTWAASPVPRRRGGTGAASFLATDATTQQMVTGTRARAARVVALEQSINRFRVEIHKKLAIAFACLVFTLLGPPLALRFPRGGVGFVVTGSAVLFFIYWVGLLSGEALADRRVADPAVTMWLGNIIMLIVGLVLASRMGRSIGTTRGGGGLSETLTNLGARLRPRTARPVPVETVG